MKKTIIILALALAVPTLSTLGQDEQPAKRPGSFRGMPEGGPRMHRQHDSFQDFAGPPGVPGGPGHLPPPSPLLAALDANHDGVIDAKEISRAIKALKKLDKNKDGKLTQDELRPPLPPDGPRGERQFSPENRQRRGPGPRDGEFSPEGRDRRGPRPDREMNGPRGGGQFSPEGPQHRGPGPRDGGFSPEGRERRGPGPRGEMNSPRGERPPRFRPDDPDNFRDGGKRPSFRPEGEMRRHSRPESEDESGDRESNRGPRGPRPGIERESFDGPKGEQRPPLPPAIAALDTNHDGVVSADELENAKDALKKLDKNGDGELDLRELLPPLPSQHRRSGSHNDE